MLKISFDQKYIYPLEENHRFPMIKYELIPQQLISCLLYTSPSPRDRG